MVVYVDELRITGQSKKFPYKYYCHMFADTTEELNEMAHRLSLNPLWLQKRKQQWHTHYDLTKSKRILAIKLGAVKINLIDYLKKVKQQFTHEQK